MREDCRHFASRTYDGEVARFCVLDLAPEAPWRCPEDCAHYERSVIDGSFVVGSLKPTTVEGEPDELPEAIADLLDDATRIVREAEPTVCATSTKPTPNDPGGGVNASDSPNPHNNRPPYRRSRHAHSQGRNRPSAGDPGHRGTVVLGYTFWDTRFGAARGRHILRALRTGAAKR